MPIFVSGKMPNADLGLPDRTQKKMHTSTSMHTSVERLQRFRDILDRLDCWVTPGRLGMQLGQPVALTEELRQRFEDLGAVFAEFLQTTGNIYREAVAGSDEASVYIRNLMEAGLTQGEREFSRQATRYSNLNVPTLYRADLINFEGAIAELQTQGGGISGAHALHNIFQGRGSLEPSQISSHFADAVRQYTGAGEPRILFVAYGRRSRCLQGFAEVLRRKHQFEIENIGTKEDFVRIAGDGIDVTKYSLLVLWGGGVRSLVDDPRFRGFMAQLSESDAVQRMVVPNPVCARRSKIALLLPFLSSTRHRYSPAVRTRIPHVRHLTPDLARDIAALSKKTRGRYLLKYAGHDPRLCWGARGVLRLGSGRQKDRELLRTASQDAMNSPWLLQDRIRARYGTGYLANRQYHETSNLCARINPWYVQLADGQLKFMSASVMYAKDWKCHGGEQTIVTPML